MGSFDQTATTHELAPVRTNNEDVDLKDAREHVEEVVINRLTEEDVYKLSRDSLTLRSRAGFRICVIMFVQGCNQAGYGIDWAGTFW